MIHLISGPRNISTSLMYSFNNRKDCQGIDEPFYAHYLKHTGLIHPMRESILATMEIDENKIVENLKSKQTDIDYLFVKNMASHLYHLKNDFYYQAENIFLIRDTDAVVNSFAKVVSDFSLDDIGIKQEFEIYQKLKDHGLNPPIIDSNELLKNPEKILREVCRQLEIPFDMDMLKWQAGPKTIDGIWAKHWYSNTHKSTRFSIAIPSEKRQVPYDKETIAKEAKKYYNTLFEQSIKA